VAVFGAGLAGEEDEFLGAVAGVVFVDDDLEAFGFEVTEAEIDDFDLGGLGGGEDDTGAGEDVAGTGAGGVGLGAVHGRRYRGDELGVVVGLGRQAHLRA
jgi:voltage-gated potassium channel Kch